MAKYARIRDGHLIDVYRVPEDYADLDTLNRCLPGGGYFVVPDDAENGAKVNEDGTYTNPIAEPPPSLPKVLTVTEFNKYGWARLGMAAFQKILEDTRNSTGTTTADYEARAAVTQYDKALTVAKSEVAAIGFKIKAAGFMTQEQFDAITGEDWPTA